MQHPDRTNLNSRRPLLPDRPLTRWWWFAERVDTGDIDEQLDWVQANGFGGVEIAWIYPLGERSDAPVFLSGEWTEIVTYAADACSRRGMRCDFTFGTLWPFGGRFVPKEHASRTDRGPSEQRLCRSWESAHSDRPGRILNHLSRRALEEYSKVLGAALAPAIEAGTRSDGSEVPCIFCDSWEVDPERLWTEGFDDSFNQEFGYRIDSWMDRLAEEPQVRFDYRCHLSHYVLEEFYRPLVQIASSLGGIARVQCHGAPTDLIDAYSIVDIPETEVLLFDPPFATISASGAAQSGAADVSCETFTCIYGWTPHPGPSRGQHEERILDLKLLADAVFANGVNRIVWHGMPMAASGQTRAFYTTTHVGPDASFVAQLPAFNRYMADVSRLMSEGDPYHRVGVYLPLEDAFMQNELPRELQRPSARWHWEMQYQRVPDPARAFAPLWTSHSYLESAEVFDGRIRLGATEVEALYVDSEWLRFPVVLALTRIAESGGRIIMERRPTEPGARPHDEYEECVDLLVGRSVSDITAIEALPPVIRIDNQAWNSEPLPWYWCRRVQVRGETAIRLFIAHPDARTISYPLEPGSMDRTNQYDLSITINALGREASCTVEFQPGRSAVIDVVEGRAVNVTPAFEY